MKLFFLNKYTIGIYVVVVVAFVIMLNVGLIVLQSRKEAFLDCAMKRIIHSAAF